MTYRTTGLETRGIRPDPLARSGLAAYVYRDVDRRLRMLVAHIVHEMLWGVPSGPTLSMLPGAGPFGIRQAVSAGSSMLDRDSLYSTKLGLLP